MNQFRMYECRTERTMVCKTRKWSTFQVTVTLYFDQRCMSHLHSNKMLIYTRLQFPLARRLMPTTPTKSTLRRSLPFLIIFQEWVENHPNDTVAVGRGEGEGGIRLGRHCARRRLRLRLRLLRLLRRLLQLLLLLLLLIWRDKNMEFWNLAASGELTFALKYGFSEFISIAGFSSWEMKLQQLQHSS